MRKYWPSIPPVAATGETSLESQTAPPTRLVSLDALRGFNMFWIIGGDDLVSRLLERSKNPILNAISANLTHHVEWEGFHFYDMIFPLFLFIAGVSIPFSMAKHVTLGATKRQLLASILRRTFTLFVLGLIYNGLLRFNGIDHFRPVGVLQRQALGYCGAALILLYCPKPKQIAAIVCTILISYWGLLALVHLPDAVGGRYSQMGNLANALDRILFKPGQMYTPYGDPEGPLSTIPAIATALLGILAGIWLRSQNGPQRKALWLMIAGFALLGAGSVWGIWFPVIKKIWTSSYVLVAGGWSLLLLALFYWIFDVLGWGRWTLFFVVIGVNPLTIYLLQEIVNFEDSANYFVGGALAHIPSMQPILLAASVLIVKWLVLWFLHKQKVYLRA